MLLSRLYWRSSGFCGRRELPTGSGITTSAAEARVLSWRFFALRGEGAPGNRYLPEPSVWTAQLHLEEYRRVRLAVLT